MELAKALQDSGTETLILLVALPPFPLLSPTLGDTNGDVTDDAKSE